LFENFVFALEHNIEASDDDASGSEVEFESDVASVPVIDPCLPFCYTDDSDTTWLSDPVTKMEVPLPPSFSKGGCNDWAIEKIDLEGYDAYIVDSKSHASGVKPRYVHNLVNNAVKSKKARPGPHAAPQDFPLLLALSSP
jgi:hypothetical protein